MDGQFLIRRMKEDELQIALDWAANEGWNPGLQVRKCFFQADPKGFFIGLLDGEPIATGAAVIYDDDFAFCGLYIVKKEFRQQGYGLLLTQERLKYVGNRITGIDGVLDNVSIYERIGYKTAHKNTRYAGLLPIKQKMHSKIVPLNSLPFDTIESFDRLYFPGKRTAFLRCWIKQPEALSLAYVENEELKGFGVIQKCINGYKLAPLFAQDSAIAHALFNSLCSSVKEGPIFLDVPEPNTEARKLAESHGMTPCFEVMRMYRNGFPKIELQGIYGITIFELG